MYGNTLVLHSKEQLFDSTDQVLQHDNPDIEMEEGEIGVDEKLKGKWDDSEQRDQK